MKNSKISWIPGIRRFCLLAVCLAAVAAPARGAARLDFTLHKSLPDRAGKTLLVFGGIQGDEPGGFNAASLLATRYNITRGNVWVVPNLNFISIVRSSRGVYGDLNRKFSSLSGDDPEYDAIQKIKAMITDPRVDAVLNLHDGSGFFRPHHIDALRNPDRWGQCVVIDQDRIGRGRLGELKKTARTVVGRVNTHLLDPEHVYHVHNTRTRDGNREMAKTLTYYAIGQGKPAFGLEVSKAFDTPTRVYYHLRLLESFMDLLGIRFERPFPLVPGKIRKAIHSDAQLAFFGSRIFLDVANARKNLRFVPFQKNTDIDYISSNPLLAVVATGKSYRIFHGNRPLTRLHPQYFEFDTSIETIPVTIDGEDQRIGFGRVVPVRRWFRVQPQPGCRVNVIGFRRRGVSNEAGIKIRRNDFMRRYSLDRGGWKYRVEVYRGDKFAGMVLVDFNANPFPRILANYPRMVPHIAGELPTAPPARPGSGR